MYESDGLRKMIEKSNEAEDLYEKLRETESMCDVDDIVESMDEDTAKMVLKKFVYSRI